MTTAIFAMLILGLFLALIRLVHGPSLPDRVVALDLMASFSIGLIAVYAVETNQALYLDVAMALALVAFLGTIAFAHFIEIGALPWRKA